MVSVLNASFEGVGKHPLFQSEKTQICCLKSECSPIDCLGKSCRYQTPLLHFLSTRCRDFGLGFFYLLCATNILLVTSPCCVITGSHRNGHVQLLFIQTDSELSRGFPSVGAVGYIVPRTSYLAPAAVRSLSCCPRCGSSGALQGCG